MRKLLLSGAALLSALFINAQTGTVSTPRLVKPINFKTVEQNASGASTRTIVRPSRSVGGSRAVSTILLGSAGNAYGSISSTMNQISVNEATNQIVFIHRTNNKIFVGDDANNGQYRYDVSRDGGATWLKNIGTVNPSGSQAGFACRYPNAVTYNPMGNTDPDSAYMTYFGPFHDGAGGNWSGYCTGRARLDNVPTMFTERRWEPNSGNTALGGSLIQSAPGIFWAVDEYTTTPDGTNPSGISVYKGTWNPDTNGVVWTAPIVLSPPLDNSADGSRHLNATCIAFDPSGMYGWIAASADVTADGEGTFDPLFYKTTDGGATWSSPIALDLDNIPGISYDPVNGPASTTFELGLTVDVNGNPHLGLIVIAGSTATPFSVLGNAPNKTLYDVTYDASFSTACQWRAIRLDYVNSLRMDIGDVSQDNYIKASRSIDGTKVFFSWVDSDSLIVSANADNTLPNHKMIGLDVVNQKRTAVKNYTAGDAIWDGVVFYPQIAPISRFATGTYNIPTVYSQFNAAMSDVDTMYFHYVSNINIASTEFNAELDNEAPDLTMLGDSLIWLAVGSAYSDSGAIASDCYDGDLTDSIRVVSTVNTSAAGVYTVTYTVTDAAGNVATLVRTVRVATAPNCTFVIAASTSVPRRFNFQYTNPGGGAVSWSWNYGNTAGVSNSTNGNIVYTYPTPGTYTVVFCATNPIGTCCDSQTIIVSSINETNISESINVYPNPATENVNVSLEIANVSDATITISNIIGENVYSKHLGSITGNLNQIIDVSKLETGMYILRLQTDKGVATKKFNVSHK